MPGPDSRVDDQRYRQIAYAAAEQATRNTLTALGVDVDNPREAQADFALLRRMRGAQEKGAAALIWTMVTGFITGVASLIWQALVRSHTG